MIHNLQVIVKSILNPENNFEWINWFTQLTRWSHEQQEIDGNIPI